MTYTMQARCREDRIRVKATGPRRETDADGWEYDHWRMTLTRGGLTLHSDYRMGTGHNGNAPHVEDVLDSMCSDASSAGQPFEDWAADYGLNVDSREAEATYHAVVAQTKKLRGFLLDKFDAYVYETERL
jgi:hypothetical protein